VTFIQAYLILHCFCLCNWRLAGFCFHPEN